MRGGGGDGYGDEELAGWDDIAGEDDGEAGEKSGQEEEESMITVPLTERDYLNPLSNFNTDLMMIGILAAIVVTLVVAVFKVVQERYEDNDKDPYDGPHVV